MPCLVWVIRYLARNQIVNSNLVEFMIVPAVNEVWARQALYYTVESARSGNAIRKADASRGVRL